MPNNYTKLALEKVAILRESYSSSSEGVDA